MDWDSGTGSIREFRGDGYVGMTGRWILTPADQEQRADRLAAQLRAMGIAPETLEEAE